MSDYDDRDDYPTCLGDRRWTFRRIRAWLALDVMLPVLYAVLGERPLFCDLASDCPLERLERENAMMREEFQCDGILDCVRCEHLVSPDECEVLEINAKHTVENVQLRNALLNALSAMRAWGAKEDGIPSDFGAWDAYQEGAALLGWHTDPEQAAGGGRR